MNGVIKRNLNSNNSRIQKNQKNLWQVIKKDFIMRKQVYLLALPVISYYFIFHYWPMYGAIIAFKNYSPSRGILESPWVGFEHFKTFFNSYYFLRVVRNTLLINLYDLIFGFPAPIIFALLLNEVRNDLFKRSIQTVTYIPHFISVIVICGMIVDFLSKKGLVNNIIEFFGGNAISFLIEPKWFRTIYVGSGIWQNLGWGSIVYLSALTGINPNLYEAARIDGAGRFKQVIHVTLPGIVPTIIILLILRIGNMMSLGFEKIILLYNPNTYETADVISSFVYRKGLLEMNYSYSSAVGLFNSVVNFILLISANKLSRMLSETSLW